MQAGGQNTVESPRRTESLAVADRLDTLAGIFTAIGKRPTGNKDPFGLRRAALAIARILIEDEIDIDLAVHIERAVSLQPVNVDDPGALVEEIRAFVVDRMKAYFLDGLAPGFTPDMVTPEIFESVRARRPASPLDFHQRVAAVCRFMQHDAAESLALANKRIANILKSAEGETMDSIDTTLFDADEERGLHAAIDAIEPAHKEHLQARDYVAVLEELPD